MVEGDIAIRRARTADVKTIRTLCAPYATQRILVAKEAVAYYESVPEFRVAERAGEVVGCGALHVFWEDLAEIRTLAVNPSVQGTGVGARLVEALLQDARQLGVSRVFCLTFEVEFFARHGFVPFEGSPVTPEVFGQLLRSYDEGTAELLDLEHVKPNTLGNTRMLRSL